MPTNKSPERQNPARPRTDFNVRHADLRPPGEWGVYIRSRRSGATLIKSPTEETKACGANSKSGNQSTPPRPRPKSNTFMYHIDDPNSNAKEENLCYTKTLIYKRNMARGIVESVKDQYPKIKINCHNGYPCVLFSPPMLPSLADADRYAAPAKSLPTLQNQWSLIIIANLVAITNHLAFSQGIGIELIHCSSFGTYNPTVSSCGESIRISVGIIPTVYASVLATAIQYIIKLFNGNFKQQLNKTPIDASFVSVIKQYDEKRIPASTIWKWLWSKGDKSGRSIAHQITNRRHLVLEAYTDQVYLAIKKNGLSQETIGQCMQALSGLFSVENNRLSVLSNSHPKASSWLAFPNHSMDLKRPIPLIDDEKFWNIMKVIFKAFEIRLPSYRVLEGLYTKLENRHHNMCKNAVTSDKLVLEPSSDSEYETDHEVPLYSKKAIVPTGMRAANLARSIAEHHFGHRISYKDIECYGYHELPDAFKIVKSTTKISPVDITRDPSILVWDLNQADCKQILASDYLPMPKDEYGVIIIDHTSATPFEIQRSIAHFRQYAPLLILINSGSKNEQGPGCRNPYGSIRIMTEDKNERDRLYDILIHQEKALHFNTSHEVRKKHKEQGLAPSTKDFFKREKLTFKPRIKPKTYIV